MRFILNLSLMVPKRTPESFRASVNSTCISTVKELKDVLRPKLNEPKDIVLSVNGVPLLDEDTICRVLKEDDEIFVKVKDGNDATSPAVDVVEDDPLAMEKIMSKKDFDFYKELESCIIEQERHILKMIKENFDDKRTVVRDCSTVPRKNENNRGCQCVSNKKICGTDTVLKTKKVVEPTSQQKNQAHMQFLFNQMDTAAAESSVPNDSSGEYDKNKSMYAKHVSHDGSVNIWKKMRSVKLSNVSELQIDDIIKFKTFSMKEDGEIFISSFITARVHQICLRTSHLIISVLYGNKDFFKYLCMTDVTDEYIGKDLHIFFDDVFEKYKFIL